MAALLLLLGLATCGQPDEVAPPSRVRLLERLEEARFEGAARDWLDGREIDPGEVLLADGFDSGLPSRWFEGIWEKHGAVGKERPRLKSTKAVEDPEDQRPVVAVFPLALGLHCLLPVSPQGTYVVTARVRAADPDEATTIQLWGRAFSDPIPADGDPAAIRRMQRPPSVSSWPPTRPTAGDRVDSTSARAGWQTLRVRLPPQPGRRTLRVSVQSQDGTFLLDSIEVRRVGPLDERTPDVPAAKRQVQHLRSFLGAGTSHRDVLMLPVPSRVTFAVRVPGPSPRLDLSAALLSGGDAAASFHVQVNGEALASRPGAGPEFSPPWVVPLDAWSGQQVDLSLEVKGASGSLALLATPELLGASSVRVRPNLLWISLDTLRADALGCYGQGAAVSPNVDALAARGVRFARVYSPSSYTLPSHATMFSGQHPLLHGALEATDRILAPRSSLLAARLQQAGACTAAFTGGGFVHPSFGFGQGFDRYDVRDPGGVPRRFVVEEDGAGDPMQPALQWLERHQDQPWFLFLHTYLIHNYMPDAEFLEPLPSSGSLATQPAPDLWRRAEEELDREAADELHRRYLASVAQADERIVGALLRTLQRLGLQQDTVVVVTSDHGEEFLEHGALGHGRYLWEESVRVPWILAGPGLAAHTVESLVSLEDAAVTVATLLGLPPIDGVSGVDALAGPRPRPAMLHMHHRDQLGVYHWEGVVDGNHKLLRQGFEGASRSRKFLYQLDWDPLELHDLSQRCPEILRGLLEDLDERSAEYLRRVAPFADQEAAGLDPELAQGLADLGYVR